MSLGSGFFAFVLLYNVNLVVTCYANIYASGKSVRLCATVHDVDDRNVCVVLGIQLVVQSRQDVTDKSEEIQQET